MADLGFEIYVPQEGESAESVAKNMYSSFLDFVEQVKWWSRNVGNDNIKSVSFDKLSGGSIDLTGAVTITGEKLTTILDEFGIDVRFLTWYPNKIKNSSFEIYDSVTKIPKHWTGTGTSTTTSAWDETCSCKLTPGQYIIQEVAAGANPQWWNTISKATRVSYHKKGGAVTISVLDSSNADTPFEIYKQEGNHGTTLEYPYNADWIPAAYSINFVHGSCTKMLVRFENTDSTYDAYVDGIIGEPDYTRKRPSMYRHGPDSVANINGESIYYSPTITVKNIDYSVTNAAEVEVTDTETTILTKTFTLDVSSDTKILFSCNGTSSDALTITFYSYQDSTARTYKPVGTMYGINSEIHTYIDTITDLAIGDYTITIKGKTSNGTYTIPIGFATLDILTIPLMTMLQTLDCTGLTLTVIDDDEIDAVWVNPTETGFSSVELYRSETDLTAQTRDWCVANATLVYSGALELYNNIGLDASTLYYYKLFAVYVDSRTHYSDGITESATTEAATTYAITELDDLTYDTSNSGQFPSLVKIDDTHLILAFTGADADGFIATYSIDSNRDNITEIDMLEHQTTNSVGHSLAMIDSTHFILAYSVSGYGRITTFSINGSYEITELNTLSYATVGAEASLAMIDSTHFILAYRGEDLDGYLETFSIDGSYNITSLNVLEHDTTQGASNSLVMIDSTHFILAYRGDSNDGYMATFSINGSYEITELNCMEHDTSLSEWNSLVMIDSTHFALAYMGDSYYSMLKTFSINGSYEITQIDSLAHDTNPETNNSYCSLVKINDTHLMLAYSGVGTDGFIKTFSIDTSYDNITQIYSLEHDTTNGYFTSLVNLDDNGRYYALAYAATADLVIKTFRID